MDTRIHPARERLQGLREALLRHGGHAVLVPSADPHLSEYLPGRWQGREWLSGFTGSMGTLVVTLTEAALFADSRYWTQAEAQLMGSGIELVRIATGASAEHIGWLAQHTPRGAQVLVDGQVLGLASAQALRSALDGAGVLLRTDLDLFTEAWPDRPALPHSRVYAHAAPQAVRPRAERLAQVREAMARHGATHHFVSTVDDTAWITALRGADVDYNPVFLSHLLIDATRATLFVGAGKLDADLTRQLQADDIQLADYAQAAAALAALSEYSVLLVDATRATLFVGAGKVPAELATQLAAEGLALADYGQTAAALAALPKGGCLLIDPRRITLGFRQQVPAGVKIGRAHV